MSVAAAKSSVSVKACIIGKLPHRDTATKYSRFHHRMLRILLRSNSYLSFASFLFSSKLLCRAQAPASCLWNLNGHFAWVRKGDHTAPDAHQLRNVVERGHIAQQNRGRSRHP